MNRQSVITGEIETDLSAYLGGIIRDPGGSAIAINGMPDHVHPLIRASKSVADAEFLRQLKGQKEHHQVESLQDEFRKFLVRYGVEFDARPVWD